MTNDHSNSLPLFSHVSSHGIQYAMCLILNIFFSDLWENGHEK